MDIEKYLVEHRELEAERAAQARKNLRILADRLGWPEGALETCERLEDENPGWSVYYAEANTVKGFERPTGFIASRDGRTKTVLVDPDPERLEESIKLASI